MDYTTQMDAARKGVITRQMEIVAAKEQMDVTKLRELLAQGKVIIPANRNHPRLDPEGIGQGLRTKINVNLGISKDCCDLELEFQKFEYALKLKAEAIMDLSCHGNTLEFRQRLVRTSPALIGTVPVYDAMGFFDKELKDITVDDFFHVVEQHAKDGVDFMTIHAGLNRAAAQKLLNGNRITNIVSRGGALLFSWMMMNERENPFYEHYDRLLDICESYDVTLSLGDGCRPGSIHDSTDACQVEEMIVLGELTRRSWEQNIQVMIEGPGHMALNEIAGNMMLEKRLCHGAPFYVLGPLVTDIAPGYDHITSAIGGAIAAANGADFLCYVTPAEHLRLPTIEDMKEGIIAARIAAHAADIAKGIPGARNWDDAMSHARVKLDWEKMFELAIDPEKAIAYRKSSEPEESDTCTMCGKMCAVRNMNRALEHMEKGSGGQGVEGSRGRVCRVPLEP
jgi:phosphomethylpyrimidine synthase